MEAVTTALEAAMGGVTPPSDPVETRLARACEALVDAPWSVVTGAGALARARWVQAAEDLGLTRRLRAVGLSHPDAVVRVPAGAWHPLADRDGRRRRGAFDTPRDLARAVVRDALAASGAVRSALDPACGPGALLLALAEAGVDEVRGADRDPRAVLVARHAVPGAEVAVADLVAGGPVADLVVGNPPFVSPEWQDKSLRKSLRARLPWLSGRFDLAVPFSALHGERVREGGVVALILPESLLVESYGASLRRRWLTEDAVLSVQRAARFPGVGVPVVRVLLRRGAGPAPVGEEGLDPGRVSALASCPLDPDVHAGDLDALEAVRRRSLPLGTLARIDTGLVAHGPKGGKARLLREEPGPGRVPFADARDVFRGEHRWLLWRPEEMHRPKDDALFDPPKLIVQRVRGRGPTRAVVDRTGLRVGHTCTVVVPADGRVALERLRDLVAHDAVAGLLRVERGRRLDLYPKDVGAVPVPRAWLDGDDTGLQSAWGLSDAAFARLEALGRRDAG